ncbi:MAG: cupin [Candidatus Neomarinimicrobiota bacterium]|nr:MAG: cupin [Candidatus Neomarinimicrobiota bacterium]
MEAKGVLNWPIWECEVSEFPWSYSERESCYILKGEIEVTTDVETVSIQPGDFVVFPQGLNCRWNVKAPVRKHYNFG